MTEMGDTGNEETFEDFAKNKGLNETTLGLMADHGYVDKNSLSVLTFEDVPALKIKQLAQRRLRLLIEQHRTGDEDELHKRSP